MENRRSIPIIRVTTMDINVNISFSGLCLFAPEAGNDPRMHVFLPPTHEPMAHAAVLVVDTAYLRPGSTTDDGTRAYIRLDEHWLNFPGTGADLTVCPEMARLSLTDPKKLTAGQLNGNGNGVASQITFGGGKISAIARGHCWRYEGKVQRLTHRVRWSCPVQANDDGSLPAEWAGLGGIAPKVTARLYPITLAGESPAFNARIFHVPPRDLPLLAPRELPPGDVHFPMLATVLGGTAKEVPQYVGPDCPGTDSPCAGLETLSEGSSPYTCVVGVVGP